MAGGAAHDFICARVAVTANPGTTETIFRAGRFFPLRAMDRARTMVGCQKLRGRKRDRADGRYSVRRQLLQRGRVRSTGAVRSRLVRWRSPGNALQRRQIHPKVGTELGHSTVSLVD